MGPYSQNRICTLKRASAQNLARDVVSKTDEVGILTSKPELRVQLGGVSSLQLQPRWCWWVSRCRLAGTSLWRVRNEWTWRTRRTSSTKKGHCLVKSSLRRTTLTTVTTSTTTTTALDEEETATPAEPVVDWEPSPVPVEERVQDPRRRSWGHVLALRLAHGTTIGPKPAADGECCKTETVKLNPSR